MTVGKFLRGAIGIVVALAGLGIILGFWYTGVRPIVGLVVLAGGLLLMGYPSLANWLEELFER